MKKLKQHEALSVAVAILVVIFFFVIVQVFMTTPSIDVGSSSVISSSGNIPDIFIENIVSGSGKEAKTGHLVTVHYVGTLEDGTVFDSSRDRGEPFKFVLGSGQVIEGWETGISGMKVGGKRFLVIPPELAYGNLRVGIIPPSSTIFFEVELIDVENL